MDDEQSERERIISTLDRLFSGLSLSLHDVDFDHVGSGKWVITVRDGAQRSVSSSSSAGTPAERSPAKGGPSARTTSVHKK